MAAKTAKAAGSRGAEMEEARWVEKEEAREEEARGDMVGMVAAS